MNAPQKYLNLLNVPPEFDRNDPLKSASALRYLSYGMRGSGTSDIPIFDDHEIVHMGDIHAFVSFSSTDISKDCEIDSNLIYLPVLNLTTNERIALRITDDNRDSIPVMIEFTHLSHCSDNCFIKENPKNKYIWAEEQNKIITKTR